jgi:hypothetical protein
MVTYYVVLSGNVLLNGKEIIGQMIINSGTVEVDHKIESYEDFEMIKEHMWEMADLSVKPFTNKSNVHISFIQKIK